MWKHLLNRRVLKFFRGSPTMTISTSDGLGSLQVVSESDIMCQRGGWAPKGVDTRRCANMDAGPRREVDWGIPHQLKKGTSRVPVKTLDPEERCFVNGFWSHIGWGGERNIIYKGTSAGENAGPRKEVNCEILRRLGKEWNILYKRTERLGPKKR